MFWLILGHPYKNSMRYNAMALGGLSIHFPEVTSHLGFNKSLNVLEGNVFREAMNFLPAHQGFTTL